MQSPRSGIPAAEDDLARVFYAEKNLHTLSAKQLAQGIADLRVGSYPYFVSKNSLFYPYLRAEGKKHVYLLG